MVLWMKKILFEWSANGPYLCNTLKTVFNIRIINIMYMLCRNIMYSVTCTKSLHKLQLVQTLN